MLAQGQPGELGCWVGRCAGRAIYRLAWKALHRVAQEAPVAEAFAPPFHPKVVFALVQGRISDPKLEVIYPETIESQFQSAVDRCMTQIKAMTLSGVRTIIFPWQMSFFLTSTMQLDESCEELRSSLKAIVPEGFVKDFQKEDSNFGLVLDGPVAVVTPDESKPPWGAKLPPGVLPYLEERCPLLMRLLSFMLPKAPKEAFFEEALKFRASPLENLLGHAYSLWVQVATSRSHQAWMGMALGGRSHGGLVWEALQELSSQGDWVTALSLVELVDALDGDHSSDLAAHRRNVLRLLASRDSWQEDDSGPWTYAMRIHDLELRVDCVLGNHLKWPDLHASQTLESLLSQCLYLGNSTLHAKVAAELHRLRLYKQIAEGLRESGETVPLGASWKEVAKHSVSDPTLVLEKLSAASLYNAAPRWAELHVVPDNCRLVVAELKALDLLTQSPPASEAAFRLTEGFDKERESFPLWQRVLERLPHGQGQILLLDHLLGCYKDCLMDSELLSYQQLAIGLRVIYPETIESQFQSAVDRCMTQIKAMTLSGVRTIIFPWQMSFFLTSTMQLDESCEELRSSLKAIVPEGFVKDFQKEDSNFGLVLDGPVAVVTPDESKPPWGAKLPPGVLPYLEERCPLLMRLLSFMLPKAPKEAFFEEALKFRASPLENLLGHAYSLWVQVATSRSHQAWMGMALGGRSHGGLVWEALQELSSQGDWVTALSLVELVDALDGDHSSDLAAHRRNVLRLLASRDSWQEDDSGPWTYAMRIHDLELRVDCVLGNHLKWPDLHASQTLESLLSQCLYLGNSTLHAKVAAELHRLRLYKQIAEGLRESGETVPLGASWKEVAKHSVSDPTLVLEKLSAASLYNAAPRWAELHVVPDNCRLVVAELKALDLLTQSPPASEAAFRLTEGFDKERESFPLWQRVLERLPHGQGQILLLDHLLGCYKDCLMDSELLSYQQLAIGLRMFTCVETAKQQDYVPLVNHPSLLLEQQLMNAEELSSQGDWVTALSLVELVDALDGDHSSDLAAHRRNVLRLLASRDSWQEDDSGPWTYAMRIHDLELRVDCVLGNHLKWPDLHASQTLESLLSQCLYLGNSTLHAKVAAELHRLRLYKQIAEGLRESGETVPLGASWKEVAKHSVSDPTLVLEKLSAASLYNAAPRWAELHVVPDNCRLVVAELKALDLLTQSPPASEAAFRLTEGFDKERESFPLWQRVLERLPHGQGQILLLDHLLGCYKDCLMDSELLSYQQLAIGLRMFTCVETAKQQDYVPLVNHPSLLLEQQLMNAEVDAVGRSLEAVSPFLDREQSPFRREAANALLETYASKALELLLLPSPSSEPDMASQPAASNSSVGSSDGAFVMPPKPPPESEWTPDTEVACCMVCRIEHFSMFSRRHHCRRCGRVVCASCSQHSMLVEGFGKAKVRVCDDCLLQTIKLGSTGASSEDSVVSADQGAQLSLGEGSVKGASSKGEQGGTSRTWSLCRPPLWLLSANPEENKVIREHFYYERAPSVSLCLSILEKHSSLAECATFILSLCDTLLALLAPKSTSDKLVDYGLIITILKSLILRAKVKFLEAGMSTGISWSEAYLRRVDIVSLVVTANCQHLLPDEMLVG
ncbi:zinc finger FYVE domain-containing protein 26 [Ixodes scapularis]